MTVLIGFLCFIIGVVVGFLLAILLDKSKTIHGSEIVLLVITAGWLLSVVWDMLDPRYETSPLIHGLMGVIAGYYYKEHKNNAEPFKF